ncbi:replicative DNA helicase [Actinoallomurus sp. NPDC052274]|uniref:replicative DNA helicase n=1 Tax=Actinoallomurus sp. NPDC052274 TaxID=3155420 RepID=UPI0034273B51
MSVTDMPSHEQEFERTPPHDLAAEQSVLGGMLLSQAAIAEVIEMIQSRDFYRPAHQTIFDRILDLYGRGDPVDAITVKDELLKRGELSRVGDAPYLHTLVASVPTAANAGYYAKIVQEKAVLRRLVEVGTRIAQLGYSTDGADADDLLDRAQAEVYAIADKRSGEDYAPLSDIMPGALDEIEAIGSRGGQMVGVPTGFTDLDALTNGLHSGQMIIVAARPAIGKALALDTPLATPTGWTTMGDVAVGDFLLGADGIPTRVVAATEVMHGRPCYEVEFSDGEIIVADAAHQWLTWTRAARRFDAQERGLGKDYARPVTPSVVTTEQIAATLRCPTADQRPNHAVEIHAPLDLPIADLPIPPYALGVWLGDGHSAGARITSADPEIAVHLGACGVEVTKGARLTYRLRFPQEYRTAEDRAFVVCGKIFKPKTAQVRTCGRSCGGKARFVSPPAAQPTCSRCGSPMTGASAGSDLCIDCWKKHGSLQSVLRTIGVLENKHIPASYLRASIQQRRDLLAGVLDTDGTVTNSGAIQLAVTSQRLAEDVRELVLSLGYRCSVTTKAVRGRTEDSSTCYMVNFTTTDQVFRLSRKQKVHAERLKHDPQRTRWRYVVDVRPVESRPVRCVQVDNDSQMYLAGRRMVPTHNSTLALDFARAAAIKHQLATVVFSLEMGRNEITMRLLSAEARVALHAMRSGSMNDEDWTRLARRMSEVAEAPLFIDDSPNMSMMEIRAKCRRLKQQHDLRLVIIDYLQLMQSGKRVESRQVEVSEFSRSLKLLAKELEVPVIALSQLNRGPEQRTDKKPMVSDLRESGSIEQDADMVILLHREDAYEKESPRAGEADLIVAKHRNGPTATVTVAFQGHYSRFVDMAH